MSATESVWDYPRPPRLEHSSDHVVVTHQGQVIVDTTSPLRILETSHPPTYYLPRRDVDLSVLKPVEGTTFCEFKGLAAYADVVVAGGSEATISPLGLGGFAAMRALSTRNDDPAAASRPWDKDRDGFVLGEGAGVMVVEEYEHAKARGAKIYAEICGYGMSADAGHMTAPSMDGPRRAMVSAMRNAGINADQVGYLNAHGTSTPLGDLNETNAIKAALGDHAKKTLISSTKSMTGHLLGGAGGIESIFTVLALHHQKVTPTINLDNQDPECDLDYCANTARDVNIEYALKNNFGFGGTNGSLVFRRI